MQVGTNKKAHSTPACAKASAKASALTAAYTPSRMGRAFRSHPTAPFAQEIFSLITNIVSVCETQTEVREAFYETTSTVLNY